MYVLHSTLLHLLSPRFYCVGPDGRMQGSNPGLSRLWHWQIRRSNHSARSHPLVNRKVKYINPSVNWAIRSGKGQGIEYYKRENKETLIFHPLIHDLD
jgi:hypothetical protein